MIALARCPPAEVPRRRISAMAAFLLEPMFTLKLDLSARASLATSTRESTSIRISVSTASMAGSNSRAPMQRLPRKQSVSIALPLVRPVKASHFSKRARPYVSGRESASIPGRPLKVVLSSSPKLYTRPSLTGIISGEGSMPSRTKSGSYSNCAISYLWSQRTEPMGWPYRLTRATSTIPIPPYSLLCNLWMPACAWVCLPCWPIRSIRSGSTVPPRRAGRRRRACPEYAGRGSATRSSLPPRPPCVLWWRWKHRSCLPARPATCSASGALFLFWLQSCCKVRCLSVCICYPTSQI